MTTHTYASHTPSGEIYALELDDQGDITSAIGPLYYREVIDPERHDYNDGHVDAEWAEEQYWHYWDAETLQEHVNHYELV